MYFFWCAFANNIRRRLFDSPISSVSDWTGARPIAEFQGRVDHPNIYPNRLLGLNFRGVLTLLRLLIGRRTEGVYGSALQSLHARHPSF
jgi:hypothetical protein